MLVAVLVADLLFPGARSPQDKKNTWGRPTRRGGGEETLAPQRGVRLSPAASAHRNRLRKGLDDLLHP